MNGRVLIVDDNPDIHEDFRKILTPRVASSQSQLDQAEEALFGGVTAAAQDVAYELTSAYQGAEAIELVRKATRDGTPYALAFVDVRMPPGLDGVETIKELWAIDPDLEVVISTAYSDYSWDQLRAKLEQADWLLILKKPFDNIEVLQLTKAMTRKWKLERDAHAQMATLRRANALLEAQREATIDGILVVDESRKILAYNGRFVQLWGVPESVTSTSDDNLLLASVASKVADPLSFFERINSLYAKPHDASRDEIVLTDGRILDRYSAPILGDQGQNFGRVWYFRDVTSKRKSANELRHAKEVADLANQAKSSFLANMSHEIRTPMTAILGYADLLAEEQARGVSADQRDEYIHTIKRNGEHLLSIINDILDLSKIESGMMELERIDTRPVNIVHDVISLMRVKADAKALKLDVVLETPLPTKIRSDPLRLRQVLVNLVGNAVKFTESGTVTIRVALDNSSPNDPVLSFSVVDSGIGMTSEQLSRLFVAFKQADASTTRKFGGTGLGLRISKRLSELLGGDISVTSRPGSGSTFTLSLRTGQLDGVGLVEQAAGATVVREVKPAAPQSKQMPLEGVRVLLAEDGKDNQRLISFHLQNAGATVTIVDNGELAVKALSADGTPDGALAARPQVDLILMDMQMPVLDGYEAARRLRGKGCTIPIVALTARAMAGDADECLEAGCDAYAAKPIDRVALIATCALWVMKSRQGAPKLALTSEPTATTKTVGVLRSTMVDDPAFGPLVHEFIDRFPDYIARLRRSLAERNFAELADIAHQLAGAGGSFGFECITDSALRIEVLWRTGDTRSLHAAAEELIVLCESGIAGAKAAA